MTVSSCGQGEMKNGEHRSGIVEKSLVMCIENPKRIVMPIEILLLLETMSLCESSPLETGHDDLNPTIGKKQKIIKKTRRNKAILKEQGTCGI